MEGALAVIIQVNEIPSRRIREHAESVVREWVGCRSDAEDWKVWIYASLAGPRYCEVIVEGPSETRKQFFFDDIETLPTALRHWLGLYPPHRKRSAWPNLWHSD